MSGLLLLGKYGDAMRMRNVRPEFFVDEDLVSLDPLTRILFVGLWCIADREGRLEDKPLRIKMQVLPADDCDIDSMLNDLGRANVIQRYTSDGLRCIQVKSFKRFQRPHKNEAASVLPAVPRNGSSEEQPKTYAARAECLRTECLSTENGVPDSAVGNEKCPAPFAELPECFSTHEFEGRSFTSLLYQSCEQNITPTWVMNPANRAKLGRWVKAGCVPGCDGSCAGACAEFVDEQIAELGSDPKMHGILSSRLSTSPRPWAEVRRG